MAIKKATKRQAEKNTAELENLFLTSNMNTDFVERYGRGQESAQIIDVAVAILARYGNTVTLDEILEAEELEGVSGERYESVLIQAITLLYALWVDKLAIINRPDNLFNAPKPTGADWQEHFRYDLLRLVVEKGEVMDFYASTYGWVDYEFEMSRVKGKVPPIVAAFNLKEDYWREFNGTFNTEDDSKTGFTVTVMFGDGMFRRVRYEGELGEIIRDLTGM